MDDKRLVYLLTRDVQVLKGREQHAVKVKRKLIVHEDGPKVVRMHN